MNYNITIVQTIFIVKNQFSGGLCAVVQRDIETRTEANGRALQNYSKAHLLVLRGMDKLIFMFVKFESMSYFNLTKCL